MTTIDVHHHLYPTGRDNEGRPWSVEATLEQLHRNGIHAAVGNLPPTPDAGVDDGPARARRWNEWGAQLCRDHPGRLGLFACLPLRDIDAALAELAHAYDALHVDGISLPTNDGDTWLSDDRFTPLLEEFDRRNAVLFVHPAATSRSDPDRRAYGGDLVSPPWLEFPTNTARTILGLLIKGIPRRYPGIRFIFCHGGGTMPALLGRIAGFDGWDTIGAETLERTFPGGIHAGFAHFYYECAQAYAPEMFALLRRVTPASHLLFGSDYSYFPVGHSVEQLRALGLDGDTHSAVAGGNAASLFPRLEKCSGLSS